MLPAMAYRTLVPDADPEQAYMLMCHRVLPAGMLGIMVAAMFSATASMVSSLLNVFAGVFACDVYRPFFDPGASERRLVLVGRLATLAYGGLMVGIALSVPYLGGAEELVLILITSLLGPLMLPAVWGVYSRHINHWAVWATLAVCTPAAIVGKFGPDLYTWLHPGAAPAWLAASIQWLKANPRLTDVVLGLVIPLGILIVVEGLSRLRGIDAGWQRMQTACNEQSTRPVAAVASRLPAQIVAASLGMLGIVMTVVTIFAASQRITLSVFSALLLLAAAGMAWHGFRRAA
jgi:Na+/proline symporter